MHAATLFLHSCLSILVLRLESLINNLIKKTFQHRRTDNEHEQFYFVWSPWKTKLCASLYKGLSFIWFVFDACCPMCFFVSKGGWRIVGDLYCTALILSLLIFINIIIYYCSCFVASGLITGVTSVLWRNCSL